MKKITLSTPAFGLVFDVHPDAKFITVDANGIVKAHYDDAKVAGLAWYSATNGLNKQPDIVGRVQLGSEQWQECIAAVMPPAANDKAAPVGKVVSLPGGERWRSGPAYLAQIAYRAEVSKLLKSHGIAVKFCTDRRSCA